MDSIKCRKVDFSLTETQLSQRAENLSRKINTNIPTGWKAKVEIRKAHPESGRCRFVVKLFNPDKMLFRSRSALKTYCEENGLVIVQDFANVQFFHNPEKYSAGKMAIERALEKVRAKNAPENILVIMDDNTECFTFQELPSFDQHTGQLYWPKSVIDYNHRHDISTRNLDNFEVITSASGETTVKLRSSNELSQRIAHSKPTKVIYYCYSLRK